MRVALGIENLIGNTPLVELKRLSSKLGLRARLLAKLEASNPAGSAKDRVALEMIEAAEQRGEIAPGALVIEPTSGNTGIGVAAICAARGYRAVIIMPDNMSEERRKLVQAYGAKLVLTPASEGVAGSVREAERIQKMHPGSIIAGQFVNPANPAAHYKTTGPEIWRDTDGQVDVLVAGIGTGGTISGAGRYLKEQNLNIRIVGVEPAESPLLTRGVAGKHGIQGIGANFVPEVLDRDLLDEIIPVPTKEALKYGRMLTSSEGLLCGISSGAALWAAVQVAARVEFEGKNIVMIMPDTGERYLSSEMFNM